MRIQSCTNILSCSLGCVVITFLASYENYPSGYALKYLHRSSKLSLPLCIFVCMPPYKCVHVHSSSSFLKKSACTGQPKDNMKEQWVHIDSFSAMSGISRFCEDDFPWR